MISFVALLLCWWSDTNLCTIKARTSVWSVFQGSYHETKIWHYLSRSYQMLIATHYWWITCPFFSLYAGILFNWNFHKSCAWCPHPVVLIYVSAVLCLQNTVPWSYLPPLALTIILSGFSKALKMSLSNCLFSSSHIYYMCMTVLPACISICSPH